MLGKFFCAVVVIVAIAGPAVAECCPHCGSRNAIGNEAAAVCPDCGQLTILGLSLPVAAMLAGALAIFAGLGLGFHVLRGRKRFLTGLS